MNTAGLSFLRDEKLTAKTCAARKGEIVATITVSEPPLLYMNASNMVTWPVTSLVIVEIMVLQV